MPALNQTAKWEDREPLDLAGRWRDYKRKR